MTELAVATSKQLPCASLKKRCARAFTLIELLVVISVIIVLAALLLPSLSGAKSQAQTTYCLNNKRELAVAWLMYAQDNQDYLAYNTYLDNNSYAFGDMDAPNWVESLEDWTTGSDCTNLALLDNDSYSSMASYVSHAAGPYHCPADTFLSPPQRALGWSQRARSVSMNWVMGDGLAEENVPKSAGSRLDYIYIESGSQVYESHLFIRLGDLATIGPSMAWVFTDEHPDSIWYSPGFFFGYNAQIVAWRQLPASYHNGGCTLSFADGHEEYKQWVVPQTRAPVYCTNWDYALATWDQTSDRRDFDWVAHRTLEPSAFP